MELHEWVGVKVGLVKGAYFELSGLGRGASD